MPRNKPQNIGNQETDCSRRETILVVDDDLLHLHSLRTLMEQAGLTVITTDHGETALEHLNSGNIGLLLLDLNMPRISGSKIMDHIITHKIDTSIIVVSGETSFEAAEDALRHGAYDYIRKPYSIDNLLNSVDNALKKRQLEFDNKLMQKKLQESEKLHRYIVNKSPDIVYMLDTEGRFTFVNKRVETLLGYSKNELIGQHYSKLIYADDNQKARFTFNERRTGKRSSVNIELRLVCKDNHNIKHFDTRLLPIEISAVGIYNNQSGAQDNHKFIGTYGIARDVTDRKIAEETIRFQAYHDLLTSLPNRSLLKDRLNQAISQARRNDHKVAVMFLDLDRFKVVNDTLGHMIGDELLRSVGQRLQSCLRDCDTLARIGGDEFTILLPEVHDHSSATEVAKKIIRNLKKPFIVEGHECFISTSIGIAHYPDDGSNMETLIKNADMAMYSIKGEGKDGYHFYDKNMQEEFSAHMNLENDMRRALNNDQFVLYFQPQIDINQKKIVAFEALIRWQHPEKGFILPSEFISLAEETGIIQPIGSWVISQCIQQLAEWKKRGIYNTRIAVNLSACQLKQDNLIETIQTQLAAHGLDGSQLEIEITENVIMKDIENGIRVLNQLHNMGIKIAIDDFGTGYSSLLYLKKLPIDTLKIDKSFIRDIHLDEDLSIIKAIITMAEGLGIDVISEGVETMAQLQQLVHLNCFNVQGFLFSRPLPAAEAIKLFDNSSWYDEVIN